MGSVLKRLMFLAVFAGPLMSAPFHHPTSSPILSTSYQVCGAPECAIACGLGGCCDYCAAQSYEEAFYCTTECWIGLCWCCT